MQTAEHAAKLFEQCLAHVQQPTIIELPEECRPVARPSKVSFTSWRVRAAMIVIGCLAVAGIFSASRPMPDRPKLNNSVEPSPSSGASSVIEDETTAWNSLQTEIDAFDEDLELPERDAEKLWKAK